MSADELVRELADVRSYSVTLDGIPLVGGKAISVIGDLRAEITRLSEALERAEIERDAAKDATDKAELEAEQLRNDLAASEAARERLQAELYCTVDGHLFCLAVAQDKRCQDCPVDRPIIGSTTTKHR